MYNAISAKRIYKNNAYYFNLLEFIVWQYIIISCLAFLQICGFNLTYKNIIFDITEKNILIQLIIFNIISIFLLKLYGIHNI